MHIHRAKRTDDASVRTEPPAPSAPEIDWQAEEAIRRLRARARILASVGGWSFGSSV